MSLDQFISWLPQTWHGWAAVVALCAYLICREWIHQWIKRASQ